MVLSPGIPLLHIIDVGPAHAIGYQGVLPCGQLPQPDEILPGLEWIGEPFFLGREGVFEEGIAVGIFEHGDAGIVDEYCDDVRPYCSRILCLKLPSNHPNF